MNRVQKTILLGLLLLLFVAVLVLLWRYPPAQLIDNVGIAQQISRFGWIGIPVFLLAGSLVTAVGLPRQLVSFVGGYSFGLLPGLLLATLAAITGCFLCFSVSRRFLQVWVRRRYSRTLTLLDGFVRQDAFLKIIVLRLQPFGTNLITNLAAGVSRIPAPVFIGSSLLGYIPQMLVFALLGSGVRVHSDTRVMVSLALFALSLLLGWYLYQRHRNGVSPER